MSPLTNRDVLAYLRTNDGATISDLNRAFPGHVTTVRRIVGHLAEMGDVLIHRSPTGRGGLIRVWHVPNRVAA